LLIFFYNRLLLSQCFISFRYVTLYDLRFTKEDHISFIKILYELMTIPNLEPALVGIFGYHLYIIIRFNKYLFIIIFLFLQYIYYIDLNYYLEKMT
jgi:hypothetical protein